VVGTKPGLPDGGGVITRLPVTDGADPIVVPVDVVAWENAVLDFGPANVSVIPSVVIVVWTPGIGMVCPLSTTAEGPMINVEPLFSVMVVEEETGIGIVEPSTTIADGELTGVLAVVGSGPIVILVPFVTIVVNAVIEEPEGRARVVVEPLGCVKVCTFELFWEMKLAPMSKLNPPLSVLLYL
jgi:hypothetical protein